MICFRTQAGKQYKGNEEISNKETNPIKSKKIVIQNLMLGGVNQFNIAKLWT